MRDHLFNYFQKQTCVRARHLRIELHVITLDTHLVQDYLFKIHTIVNALASIGDHIPHSHYIDVILERLPGEFAHVVFVVESKFGVMDIDEVEILLLAYELRLTTFNKQ